MKLTSLTVAAYEGGNDLCCEFRGVIRFIRAYQLFYNEYDGPWITIAFFLVRFAFFVSVKNERDICYRRSREAFVDVLFGLLIYLLISVQLIFKKNRFDC